MNKQTSGYKGEYLKKKVVLDPDDLHSMGLASRRLALALILKGEIECRNVNVDKELISLAKDMCLTDGVIE